MIVVLICIFFAISATKAMIFLSFDISSIYEYIGDYMLDIYRRNYRDFKVNSDNVRGIEIRSIVFESHPLSPYRCRYITV